MDNKKIWVRPFIFGAIASISLTLAYFAILSYLNSFSHAVATFLELWYFMVPLVIGFGLQIALFTYIRNAHRHSLCNATDVTASATASAASGSVSSASMVACCLHHITDVLPLAGFSAAVIFINKFQSFFLMLGVFSSAAGLLVMLRIIKKHSLYLPQQRFFTSLMRQNIDLGLKIVLVAAAIFLGIGFAAALKN